MAQLQPVRTGALSAADVADLYASDRLGLVRLAVLLVDDVGAAEDVVQDAFAQLVRRASALRDPGAAHAYLRTAVVNGCRSALRRRRTARAYVAPLPVAPDGPEANVVLAEDHREVLVLRYWSGLSEAEIAAALGISRGAVKSTASRALDVLQGKLEDAR